MKKSPEFTYSNRPVIVSIDYSQFEILKRVFIAALHSDLAGKKECKDFYSLWKDIEKQMKNPSMVPLVMNYSNRKILQAVLHIRMTRIQQMINDNDMTPGIRKLYENSHQNMSNIINQLDHENTI